MLFLMYSANEIVILNPGSSKKNNIKNSDLSTISAIIIDFQIYLFFINAEAG